MADEDVAQLAADAVANSAAQTAAALRLGAGHERRVAAAAPRYDGQVTDDSGISVSWKLIEPGWGVHASGGELVGHVFKTVGDSDADIFDGLAIVHHDDHGYPGIHNYWDRPRYVAAEQVAAIADGEVTLALTAEQSNELPLHDVPESAQIEPESASRRDRLETAIERDLGEDKTR